MFSCIRLLQKGQKENTSIIKVSLGKIFLIRNIRYFRDRSQINKRHGSFKFGYYNYLCIEVVSARTRSKGKKTHITKLRIGDSVTLFSSTHPVPFAPLNQGPSQVSYAA